MSGMRGLASRATRVAALGLLLLPGGAALAQNTIGGEEFPPGVADFPQNGTEYGRGPGFQFSDDFYRANGIDPDELRRQEDARPPILPNGDANGSRPARQFAWYRGDDDGTDGLPIDLGTVTDPSQTDPRFTQTRIVAHNAGFNAAGELLYYPDPPAFFFPQAITRPEVLDRTNISFVYGFPRQSDAPTPFTAAQCPQPGTPEGDIRDLLDPGPCGRRQDNIFDTGNGYLTANPLQLWRIVFVTWDGPDVNTPQCQAEMARLGEKNGYDLDGTPIMETTREVLNVAGPDIIEGQPKPVLSTRPDSFFEEIVRPNQHPGARGLPNPDPRADIPNTESEELGQICVTVRARRQTDSSGNPVLAADDPTTTAVDETLDGPPFVV